MNIQGLPRVAPPMRTQAEVVTTARLMAQRSRPCPTVQPNPARNRKSRDSFVPHIFVWGSCFLVLYPAASGRLPPPAACHTTCPHTTCPHTTCSRTTCPHTICSHTTCPHTTCSHTTCPHTTCYHTTCSHTACTCPHTTCSRTTCPPHNLFSHNLSTHNLFSHNLSTHNLLSHHLLAHNFS